MTEQEARKSRFCARYPECDGIAEPEEDGEVAFFKCAKCEFEFGYVVRAAQADDACQLGIPEDIRASLSFTVDPAQPVGVMTLRSGDASESVFLGNFIRMRRAEDDPGT